jgi:hypothetical protein
VVGRPRDAGLPCSGGLNRSSAGLLRYARNLTTPLGTARDTELSAATDLLNAALSAPPYPVPERHALTDTWCRRGRKPA